MSNPAQLRVAGADRDPASPVQWYEFKDMSRTVSEHESDINEPEHGLKKRIEILEHKETGRTAVLGFITYLLGVITAFAAIWALKP